MYKKVLIMGMLFLGSLNFCFGANIQCWEENINPWDSRVLSNYYEKSNNFSASDSKLYNTLKDKATVIFVGVNTYRTATTTSSDGGITAMPSSYILYNDSSWNNNTTGKIMRYSLSNYIALKFCAVFNDSASSSTSTNATASVNYIIKAK